MRILPIILLLALLGCGDRKRELASSRLSHEIQQWIPDGTPLASAQKILDQHQFTCSVTSYTNKQGMFQGGRQDLDAILWDTPLWVNGKSVPVTNVTHLAFDKTNAGGVLTYINGEYSGRRRVTAVGR